MSWINSTRAMRNKELKGSCKRVGYYLVHSSGRFFISEKVSESALNSICNKVLTNRDYLYWIDYNLGLDVDGKVAWANLDYTDNFI